MNRQVVPKYAHLEYKVLHELEVSIAEYFFLDMIHCLSRAGWCQKKLENIAFDMRMTKKGIIKMRNRLIERKLLIKGVGNRLKTPEKVNLVYFFDESELQKRNLVPKKGNLVAPKRELSSSKTSVENNIKNNKEYKGDGYKKFLAAKDSLKMKLLS